MKYINKTLYYIWCIISIGFFGYIIYKHFPQYIDTEFPLFIDLSLIIFLPSFYCLIILGIHFLHIINKHIKYINLICLFIIIIGYIYSLSLIPFSIISKLLITPIPIGISVIYYTITTFLYKGSNSR